MVAPREASTFMRPEFEDYGIIMHCYFIPLVCLSMAVSPILSITQVIPKLQKKIEDCKFNANVYKQEQEFGKYRAIACGADDAARFNYINGEWKGEKMCVTIQQKSNQEIITKTYDMKDNGDGSCTQTNEEMKITVLSMYADKHCCVKYGFCEGEGCGDGTNWAQADVPADADDSHNEECKQKLVDIVGEYFAIESIGQKS